MRGLLLVLVLLGLAPSARADGDSIWSALVLATKEETPRPAPDQLEEIAPTLKKVFGYNTFYLLGDKKKSLVTGGEEWLIPSEEFFVKVKCLSRDPAHYNLAIDLYRGEKLLVTTQARLAKDAPLIIRGPQWGRGQLVFVLEVR